MVNIDWQRVARLIPNYDPFETAPKDCYFDEQIANNSVEFFHTMLTHVKGSKAGEPIITEEWQQAIIGNLWGWKRENKTRRYRDCFIYVPKKNSKTTMCAGFQLLSMFTDGEKGAENYVAAAEKEQAKILFDIAKNMIKQKQTLAKYSKIYLNSIIIGTGFLKPLSSEADTKEGYNTNILTFDELHVQKKRNLLENLETGMASRDQPLSIKLTTADFERPSICNEEYFRACKVRDGIIKNPFYLPVIYEALIDDDWHSEEVWKKANPNYGISVSIDYMKEKHLKAIEIPSFENTFKRKHLNVRTGQMNRWLNIEKWDACKGELSEAEMKKKFKGRKCIGALDLGATSDLTSLCLMFKDKEQFHFVWFHWCPKKTAHKRSNVDQVQYDQWSKEGLIKLTEGDEIDYDFIQKDINKIGDDYGIEQLAIDRLFQGAQLAQGLIKDGFDVIKFGQGFYSMAAPTKEFEEITNRGKLVHGGNGLIKWMVSNVSVKEDEAGNKKPDKKSSGDKIDGIVTGIMALGLGILQVEKVSVYEKRGIRRLRDEE